MRSPVWYKLKIERISHRKRRERWLGSEFYNNIEKDEREEEWKCGEEISEVVVGWSWIEMCVCYVCLCTRTMMNIFGLSIIQKVRDINSFKSVDALILSISYIWTYTALPLIYGVSYTTTYYAYTHCSKCSCHMQPPLSLRWKLKKSSAVFESQASFFLVSSTLCSSVVMQCMPW